MDADQVKQNFLVVYDYGMGGVWAFVRARSREDIEAQFPELVVYTDPPESMSEADIARVAARGTYDLDTDRTFGLLAEILDSRSR